MPTSSTRTKSLQPVIVDATIPTSADASASLPVVLSIVREQLPTPELSARASFFVRSCRGAIDRLGDGLRIDPSRARYTSRGDGLFAAKNGDMSGEVRLYDAAAGANVRPELHVLTITFSSDDLNRRQLSAQMLGTDGKLLAEFSREPGLAMRKRSHRLASEPCTVSMGGATYGTITAGLAKDGMLHVFELSRADGTGGLKDGEVVHPVICCCVCPGYEYTRPILATPGGACAHASPWAPPARLAIPSCALPFAPRAARRHGGHHDDDWADDGMHAPRR